MIRQTGKIKCRSTVRFITVIILSQLLFCPAWGLDPDKPVDQYLVDQWETSDGLPSNTVISITQTPDGYLWLATSKGLARFDGITFNLIPYVEESGSHPPEETTPYTLLADNAGLLWIGGSPAGLTAYNYKTGKFKTYTGADGLTKDRIRRITKDMKGNLWLGFWASYANRFSNGTFTPFNRKHGLLGKKINAIVEDRNGNLLFGSREKGVYKYKGGVFTPFPVQGLEGRQLIAMYEDRKGDLWIGTNEGLFRVSPGRTTRYTAAHGLSNGYITDIKEDHERNLWVGTLGGLNRITREKDGTITVESLLNSFKVICLFEDSEKSLWAGTFNWGLKRVKDGKFISYAPLDTHKGEMPLSLYRDPRGFTWIGTFNGKLLRFRGSRFIQSVQPPRLSGTGISAIAQDDDGHIWLGTNGSGVYQIKNIPRVSKEGTPKGTKEQGTIKQDSITRYTTADGLTDNQVSSIFRDSRGNMWFSTADGVSVLSRANGKITSFTSIDGLSGKVANNTYEDKDHNIWIAADKGITVLKDGSPEKSAISVYLEGAAVTAIYLDPGGGGNAGNLVWAATHGGGLKRLKTDGRGRALITSYTTAGGMPSNFVYQFHEDRHGRFWMMSKNGILRVNKAELNRFADKQQEEINCVSYGISDGLKSPEFNNEYSRNSALQTPNRELWFITKMGISIVNPETIRINKKPPPVVIEGLYINNRPIAPQPKETGAYTFKGTNRFSVRFTAPTYLSPENIKFKYRLEGHTPEWKYLPPGKERAVHYPGLEPGTYTFTVTAANAEGIWNDTGDSVTVTILPYFHQTLWFKLILVLLIAVLAAGAFFLYKNLYKKISRAKALKQTPAEKEKYKDSKLNPVFVEEIIKRLKHQVEVEKVYRDPVLTLQSLAKKLAVPPHQLSQVINDRLKRNFPDYINYHRIEEARWILEHPGRQEIKITSMAFDVGFNTMPAFYNAFKKYTGMTPGQYKTRAKKRNKKK